MKVTTLRVSNPHPLDGEAGTGKYNKEEVYPYSQTLVDRLELKINKQELTTPELIDVNPVLRDYQVEDLAFLVHRKSAACFNEQRTGKTPVALNWIIHKGLSKVLIVVPASMLYTWATEAKRWTSFKITVADGTASKRKQLIKEWTEGLLIISYECLRERVTTKDGFEIKIGGDISDVLSQGDIEGIIVDEAHRIKNHKSNQADALFRLAKIPNKLVLTGTPAPGKQHEVYSILHFLFPTIFTGYWRFIEYYFTQATRFGNYGEYKDIGTFKKNKDKELQEFLNLISTRRLRASVMPWLPAKDKETIEIPLSKEQDAYITELKESFEIEGTEVDASNLLTMLMRIRQICLAPELLSLKGKSPKTAWIKQYLKDYPDKNVIIFSKFTSYLELLSRELNEDGLITGKVSKQKREVYKNEFQEGTRRILLINIDAGKEGLTLDNADVIIFTDKFPPIGTIQQAEDRFVATNKSMLHRDHTIYDLVMQDSYEENIKKLLDNNAAETDVVNNFKDYLLNR